jgi:hypothetical protein
MRGASRRVSQKPGNIRHAPPPCAKGTEHRGMHAVSSGRATKIQRAGTPPRVCVEPGGNVSRFALPKVRTPDFPTLARFPRTAP